METTDDETYRSLVCSAESGGNDYKTLEKRISAHSGPRGRWFKSSHSDHASSQARRWGKRQDNRVLQPAFPRRFPPSGHSKNIEDMCMIISMRESGLAPNSIRNYTITLKAFLSWCIAELNLLLKKSNVKQCSFTEYRSWVIVNLLVNSECRAGTVRNIENRDSRFLSEISVLSLRFISRISQSSFPAISAYRQRWTCRRRRTQYCQTEWSGRCRTACGSRPPRSNPRQTSGCP